MGGYWDVGFWIVYLLPLGFGFGMGWWLRGEKAHADEDDRRWVARRIEAARERHPSNGMNVYDEWRRGR